MSSGKRAEPLSNFAFKFNLRRFPTVEEAETGDPNVDFESVLPFAMREFMPEVECELCLSN